MDRIVGSILMVCFVALAANADTPDLSNTNSKIWFRADKNFPVYFSNGQSFNAGTVNAQTEFQVLAFSGTPDGRYSLIRVGNQVGLVERRLVDPKSEGLNLGRGVWNPEAREVAVPQHFSSFQADPATVVAGSTRPRPRERDERAGTGLVQPNQAVGSEEKGYVVGGRSFTGGFNLPDAVISMRATCSTYVKRPRSNFCKNPDKYAAYYDAVSKSVGVPSVALVCMTYAETAMAEGLRNSSAGAAGLTQFMPETAKDYVRRFNQKKDWQDMFARYKSTLNRQDLNFNAADIRRNQLTDTATPVALFASGLYFRDALDSWSGLMKTKADDANHFFHLTRAMMAGYNAGPRRGTAYYRGNKRVPGETAGYMPKIEGCVKNAINAKKKQDQRVAGQ